MMCAMSTQCFVAYDWSFVFRMHMHGFKVQLIEFGFKNMSSRGALGMRYCVLGARCSVLDVPGTSRWHMHAHAVSHGQHH